MPVTFSLRRHRCRHGFTLTELAIVLGVIGLIIGAVWSGAATVFQRQRVNDQITQLKTVIDNIRAQYSAAKTLTYSNGQDITAAMIAANLVPTYMIVPGNSYPQSVEGGNITILYLTTGTFNSTPQIQINVAGVPKSCNGVLSYYAGMGADLYVSALYANAGPSAGSWQNPANNTLDSTSFGGCSAMQFQFNLHN